MHKCNYCNKKLSSKSSMNYHINKNVCGKVDIIDLTCLFCGEVCKNNFELLDHLNANHHKKKELKEKLKRSFNKKADKYYEKERQNYNLKKNNNGYISDESDTSFESDISDEDIEELKKDTIFLEINQILDDIDNTAENTIEIDDTIKNIDEYKYISENIKHVKKLFRRLKDIFNKKEERLDKIKSDNLKIIKNNKDYIKNNNINIVNNLTINNFNENSNLTNDKSVGEFLKKYYNESCNNLVNMLSKNNIDNIDLYKYNDKTLVLDNIFVLSKLKD